MPGLIQSEIKGLLVRLILKAGKRQAIERKDTCIQCQQPVSACLCHVRKDPKPKGEVIRVTLDKKGRKGKMVTVASGFSLDLAELEGLATELKMLCGSGGTVKDGQIEIQGDHRDRLIVKLDNMGYRPKCIGG